MRDSTDRLEREVAAAFEEVLRARPDDEAQLAAMIDAALKTPPGPPPSTGGAGRPWLKLLGGAGGLAVAVVAALSVGGAPQRDAPVAPPGPAGAVQAAPAESSAGPSTAPGAHAAVAAAKAAAPPSEPSAEPWTTPTVSPAPSVHSPRRAPRRRAEPTAAPADATPEADDPDAWLRAANQARRARDFAGADRLYDELRARFPESRAARTSRVPHGRLLLDTLGRPADALECFSQYLAADPRGTLAEEALVGRAQALGQLGRRAEMQAAWRTLLAQFPESMHTPTARSQLAEAGP